MYTSLFLFSRTYADIAWLSLVDQNASSSYTPIDNIDFDITYLDGRNIKGSYFNDTVHIGDASVKNQQLGLALESVRPTGIMGLGFSSNVAASRKYPTVVDNLVEQGFINAPVYSLYLVNAISPFLLDESA